MRLAHRKARAIRRIPDIGVVRKCRRANRTGGCKRCARRVGELRALRVSAAIPTGERSSAIHPIRPGDSPAQGVELEIGLPPSCPRAFSGGRCDAATLAVLLAALDHPIPIAAVFAAFILAAAAELVGPMPGGLGAFEGGCIFGLRTFGVPVETALARATLSHPTLRSVRLYRMRSNAPSSSPPSPCTRWTRFTTSPCSSMSSHVSITPSRLVSSP